MRTLLFAMRHRYPLQFPSLLFLSFFLSPSSSFPLPARCSLLLSRPFILLTFRASFPIILSSLYLQLCRKFGNLAAFAKSREQKLPTIITVYSWKRWEEVPWRNTGIYVLYLCRHLLYQIESLSQEARKYDGCLDHTNHLKLAKKNQ